MERNIYLNMVSIEEAIKKIKSLLLGKKNILGSEVIPTDKALYRVLSRPVFACYSSPTFHAAAMDGIAVHSNDTFGAREGNPKILIRDRDFIEINTGNPLPEGFDAVIMIEDVVFLDENTVSIEKPAFPWQHVRRIGEDIVATELIFPAGHKISPYDLGTLLSAGIFEVEVREKLKVGIVPTGDEVLDFTLKPNPKAGEVIESNSQVLASLLEDWDCEPVRIPPVGDDFDLLVKKTQALLEEVHILVIGAGSSAGSKDFTKKVMQALGEVVVHGIKAMPGKPSLLGISREGKLIVGAPGYPVSAVICFEYLLRPLIYWLRGENLDDFETINTVLTRPLPSKLGMREFIRVGIGKVGGRYVSIPLPRGAGMITTLSRATGLISIDENSEGFSEGEVVSTRVLRPKREIENALVVIGSHDNLLDLLKNELMSLGEPVFLFSAHVGSLGGLKAIKNKYAHFAGTHLFDPATEDYNFPFIEKILPEEDTVLVNLAIRKQGLIVAKGNPKNIRTLEDLVRDDVVFINRQRGAGTRILLDYYLNKLKIKPTQIKGYDQEEFTHMAVAVNVLTGTADCGLGIMAAAKALNLDFIPLVDERYDLLIRRETLNEPAIQKVLEIISSVTFRQKAESLGGYDLKFSGEIMQPKK
ncbi:putative molybdopterin biosynthesis protein [Desulfonauticus submarinus]|uniref:Molybdopterin molybdenumtransferase n=1 Tax=Desulfonauticus submarinus TaxID=206665 RepID=A0A1H0E0G1_9BACT|nr:molybdopterin biosynthesis protein [Desulfonauticus submarinus]SDN75882.1 putative molybdopterin biosynthesis protein [Desulfonauticus submarinus]